MQNAGRRNFAKEKMKRRAVFSLAFKIYRYGKVSDVNIRLINHARTADNAEPAYGSVKVTDYDNIPCNRWIENCSQACAVAGDHLHKAAKMV